MMIYLSNIAIFIDLPLRALKKHQTGRQDGSPAKDTGRFSNQLNNCQKIAGKNMEKKLDNGKNYRRTHNNDPRPTLRLNDFTGTFRTA